MDIPRTFRSVARLLASAAVFSAVPLPAFPQESGSVAGQVTVAAKGIPLAGVQIHVEGTSFGTLSDEKGRYSLPSVPAGPHRLRVIHLGFGTVTQDITVAPGQRVTADFALHETAIALDEIVVTATGEQRRRELGHTIAAIDAVDLLQSAPVTNTFDLLQARAPGVQVINSAGGVGLASRIRIRGSNSLSLSNEPVIYMDGIRIESGAETWLGTGGQDLGRLNDLNPEEIESIEIVKGPSAAALYGTKAANGVILITTRKGKPGQRRWNVYAEGGGIRDPYTYPDNYMALDAGGGYCPVAWQATGRCQGRTLTRYQPLEDERVTIFGAGWRQQYGASVSGGTDQVRYFVSGEWEEEVGPYELKGLYRQRLDSLGFDVKETTTRPQQLHKASLRTNLSAHVAESAVLDLNLGYVRSRISLTPNDNTVFSVMRLGYYGAAVRPERVEYDPGIWYGEYSPEMLFGGDQFSDVNRFTGSVRLSWDPLEWLELRAVAGTDIVNREETEHIPTGLLPHHAMYRHGFRQATNRRIDQQTLDLGATGTFQLTSSLGSQLSLGFQFLRDRLHGLGGWTFEQLEGSETISTGTDQASYEDTGESRTLGAFMEERLSWRDRLFLAGAVRLDDNSAFGRNFDAIVYPKLSASWLLSEEDWFPEISQVGQIRLRSAWGWSGLQPGSTAALLSLRSIAVNTQEGASSGVVMGNIGNPDLEPETSREVEAGLDAELFRGRLGVEITYYRKVSENALVLRPLPPSTGAPSARWENLASVSNRGLEVGLTATPVSSPAMEWQIHLSGAANENEVLRLGGVTFASDMTDPEFREGFPAGSRWARPIESFQDLDGNGILTPNEVVIGEEERFLGPMLPAREVSFQNTLTLRGWIRMYALFNYRGGFVVYNATASERCRNYYCRAMWDPSTPLKEQARVVASQHPDARTPVGFMEDGDFVKLREAGVTLLAPGSWANRIGAEGLSLTLTGRNLATWTGYSGNDPEVNVLGVEHHYGTSQWGASDYLSQAPFRYWTVRVNVEF